ncbi:MAG: hypothetical protein ACR2LA_05515 [Acidimicrobiales bacterium]
MAELARAWVVEFVGQRGARALNVDLDESFAVVQMLLLDGEMMRVSVQRQFGHWRVLGMQEE